MLSLGGSAEVDGGMGVMLSIREAWSERDEQPFEPPIHKRDIVLGVVLAIIAFLMFAGGLAMIIRDYLT